LIHHGIWATGMNTPLTKSRGKRKKFIKVIASKTALTMTNAMIPRADANGYRRFLVGLAHG
jgi:hypothetical protein